MGIGIGELAILALVGFVFVGLVNGRRHGRVAAVGLGLAIVLVALFCLRSVAFHSAGTPLTVSGEFPIGGHEASLHASIETPQAQLAILPVIFLILLSLSLLALVVLAVRALVRSRHGGVVLAILLLPLGLLGLVGLALFWGYSTVRSERQAAIAVEDASVAQRAAQEEMLRSVSGQSDVLVLPDGAQVEIEVPPDAPAVAPPTEDQLAATRQFPTLVEAEAGAAPLPPDAAPPTDSSAAGSIAAEAPDSPTSDERPAWVDAPPRPTNGNFQFKTLVGPYPDEAGCETALQSELVLFYRDYIAQRYGPEAAALLAPASGVVLRAQLVRSAWLEPLESPSLGRMWQLHALVEVSAARQTELQQQVRLAFSQRRARHVLVGAGAVFSILGALFACLKLDTLTQGYYTGRLRLGAAVVIGAVVAAVALLS